MIRPSAPRSAVPRASVLAASGAMLVLALPGSAACQAAKRDPAAWLFQAAAPSPSGAPASPATSALQLAADGYAAISAGDRIKAARSLEAALETGALPPEQARLVRLTLSDVLAQLGRPAQSVEVLSQLASDQSFDVQARRAFALEGAGRKAEAAQAFLAAEASAPSPEARLLMAKGRIYALVALGRGAEALADIARLEATHDLPGKDAVELAYVAVTNRDDALALRLFARAEDVHQLSAAAALDAGYTARRAGEEARSLAYFREGLRTLPPAATPADVESRFQLEREVADMSRRWGVYAAMLYDTTNSVAASLPRSGAGNVQAGFEAYYRPLGYNAGRPLELFARAFETLASKRGDPTGAQTIQGWVGVRDKPFASQNLVLEASRVFKVGKTSRDDWMLRAGYSATAGLDLRQDKTSWLMRHVFIDAAQLIQTDETFVVAEGRLGWSYRVAPHLIVAPFLGASLAYDSALVRPTAVGAGPGLWVRPWFRATDHAAPQSYVDIVLQYRARIAGDQRAEGFLTTLSLSY